MEDNFGYQLLLMMFIVALNAFFARSGSFAGVEPPVAVAGTGDEGNVRRQAAVSLLSNSERLLSVVQVGVTLCSLALGVVGERPIEDQLPSLAGTLHVELFDEEHSHHCQHRACLHAEDLRSRSHRRSCSEERGYRQTRQAAVILSPAAFDFLSHRRTVSYVLEKSAAIISKAIGLRG